MSPAGNKLVASLRRHVRVRRLGCWVLVMVGGAVALVLLAHPAALAGDLLSNVGPGSQLHDGALMDAHPLDHYALDHHFSAVKAGVFSGVDVSGIPPMIAWFLANVLWQLTAFLAHAVITLFTFAFSLDLVNGSGATGGANALEPVSRAVQSIYQHTFGEPWLIVAILLTGLWAIYHALVRRRYVETAGSLAMSVLFVVIALAFVTQPERTIGSASKWSNAMSSAFLSLTTSGSVSDPDRAKQGAADQLFTLLVYEPWTVLQFGGREQCVKSPVQDKPQSLPVRPLSENPARDGELSRRLQRTEGVTADGKVCVSNRNKHAPRFLQHASGSDERDKQYEALKDGDRSKLHDDDPAKTTASYQLSPADRPAAEAMGKGGQDERLLLAIVIFAGELGILLLLGALSVSVILAQVLVLLLLAFAPIALVVGVFPNRGHEFFLGWLSRLGALLLRKAIYSLILAVLLAVGAAINEATSSLGWLMAFLLQGAFFWAVFLGRGQLVGQLTLATTGRRSGPDNQAVRFAALYATARMASRVIPSQLPTPPRRPRLPRPKKDEEPKPPDSPPDEPDKTNDDAPQKPEHQPDAPSSPHPVSAPVHSGTHWPDPGAAVPATDAVRVDAPPRRALEDTTAAADAATSDTSPRSPRGPAQGAVSTPSAPATSPRALRGGDPSGARRDAARDSQPPTAVDASRTPSPLPAVGSDDPGRPVGATPAEHVTVRPAEDDTSPLERDLRSDARRLSERPRLRDRAGDGAPPAPPARRRQEDDR